MSRSVDRRRAVDAEKFGYRSLHTICALPDAAPLPPTFRFEVQVRTVLQHAWAEVEHDLGYKAASGLPPHMRRRFSRVASLLEIADEEFVALRNELAAYQTTVRQELTAAASVPLDVVSLDEVTRLESVTALDALVAQTLSRPRTEARFSPDYLLRLLKGCGLDTTLALERAIAAHGPSVERAVRSYFAFTQHEWRLLPQHVEVARGYGLFFVAHLVALQSAAPEETLTAVYRALDFPHDDAAARRVAQGLVTALRG